MRRIYNFGTIEIGEMYRGPGVVVGVFAIAADGVKVHYQFREEMEIDERIQSITNEFQLRSAAAKEAGLTGVELFRSFVAPRQSPIQFVTRGTRYCESGKEREMMEELFVRFTPPTVLS